MIKQHNPTTPGQRHKISVQNKYIITDKKQLTVFLTKTGGRNNSGKITTRHIGGGHKKRIRLVDNLGEIGAYAKSLLIGISYDPNHTSSLGLFKTPVGKKFLRLLPENKPVELFGKYAENKVNNRSGNILPLRDVVVGEKVFNIQISNTTTTQLAKSAGSFATIVKQDSRTTLIRLPSKKIKTIQNHFLCTIGVSSNINNNKKIWGKAGASRWRGIRPTVRGEAMNPVDHPHGGETSGGVRLKTVYGKLAKFTKTR